MARSCTLLVLSGFLVLGHGASALGQGVAPPAPRERTIVIGRVSEDPKKHFPRLESMAKYLARRLEPLGISARAAVVARNNRQMIGFLRHGTVDLVSETAFSAMLFSREAGADIILREWKGGSATYRTVFIARTDSGIESLADLRGKTIAFEDRGSTTAFLLPLAILRREGIQAVELPSSREAPPADKIGYVFARGEVNIMAWVVKGLADAGAISNLDWEDLARAPARLKEDVRIFDTTRPILRSLVIARKGLDPKLKARIEEILLTMHTDPAGREALETYNRVARYDRIKGEAARSIEEVRRLVPLINQELN